MTTENNIAKEKSVEKIMFVRKPVAKGKPPGPPLGILVSGVDYIGQTVIGWSYANRKAGDSFNKRRGLEIARGRINVKTHAYIPRLVERAAEKFREHIKCPDAVLVGKPLEDKSVSIRITLPNSNLDEPLSSD